MQDKTVSEVIETAIRSLKQAPAKSFWNRPDVLGALGAMPPGPPPYWFVMTLQPAVIAGWGAIDIPAGDEGGLIQGANRISVPDRATWSSLGTGGSGRGTRPVGSGV